MNTAVKLLAALAMTGLAGAALAVEPGHVIDPKDWRPIYRGPMEDRLSYERQRPAQHHYLIDALDAVVAGQPVKTPKADGVGCLVNFPERERKTSQRMLTLPRQVTGD